MQPQKRPNYDFKLDLPIAQKTEHEVSFLFDEYYGYKTISICNTKAYDLLISDGKKQISIEVKEDFTCEKTGNVGVEFRCRGRDSGVRTTEADYYVYKVHTPRGTIEFLMISVEKLRSMIFLGLYHRVVVGGDPESNSMNYLFHLETFRRYARPLFR